MSQAGGNLGNLNFTVSADGAPEAAAQIGQVGDAAKGAAEKAEIGFNSMKRAVTTVAASVGAAMLAFKALEAVISKLESMSIFGPSMADSLSDIATLGQVGADRMKSIAVEIEKTTTALEKLSSSTVSFDQVINTLSGGTTDDALRARLATLIQQREDLANAAMRQAAAEKHVIDGWTVGNDMLELYIRNQQQRAVLEEQTRISIEQTTDAITKQGEAITKTNEAALKLSDTIAGIVASQNSANNALFASARIPPEFSRMADQLDQVLQRMPRR